jgi:ankyrin repeat protein
MHAYIDAGSPNGTTPLMMAARYGTGEAVDLLLAEGADARLKNQQGLTALQFAEARRTPDIRTLTALAASQYQPVSGPLRGVRLVSETNLRYAEIFYDVYYVN